MIWIVAASVWGVAEAKVFFIVPDVLLTVAVLRFGFRTGLRLAVVTALFASLAGFVMWLWAKSDPMSARHTMLLVPAVGVDLLTRAHSDMAGYWPVQLFAGAVTGLPYKLYAVEAGARGINPFAFAAVSFAARLMRFSLSTGLVAIGREVFTKLQWTRWSYAALALVWIALYVIYFDIRAAT